MFDNIYKDKKVLVTGNSGFKGSWLTLWLLKLGAKVSGVSLDAPSKPSMFEELSIAEKISHHEIDIRDLELLENIIKDESPDFIFHLAAQSLVSQSYKNPFETISTNILGVSNILESLKYIDNDCVAVIITSDKCYNNVEWSWGYRENDQLGGKDIYSGSKAAAEIVFNSYYHSFFADNGHNNIRIASARAGNVIGGGDWAKDRIVPDCIRAWNSNEIVDIRNPNSTRPWQHVLEPLSGYLRLGQRLSYNKNLNGESFNFGPSSKYNHTVENLLIDLSSFWKFNDLSKVYRIIEKNDFIESELLKLNCDKSLIQLGWLPTLDYGNLIDFTGSWYYDFYNERSNIFELTIRQIKQYEKFAIERGISWAK